MSRYLRRRLGVALASLPVLLVGQLAATVPAQADEPARSPALSMFTEQVPIPPVLDARGDGSGAPVSLALDEVVATHSFHAALPATPTFGYLPAGTPASDAYLGPTIEARRGTPIDLTVTNRLVRYGPAQESDPAVCKALGLQVVHPLTKYMDLTLDGASDLDRCAPPTSVHVHGGHNPVLADGGPLHTFRAAGVDPNDFGHGTGSVTYQYVNDQEATGLWYHDHALASTRFNPLAGLAGFYLVRDAYDTGNADNPLGLPSGVNEVPLVLQDRSFAADGTFTYPTEETAFHPLWAPESFGDVATVNGKAWPNLNVSRGLYRVRLLNGSNARFYRLTLVDAKTGNLSRVPVYQIGDEGGLLNKPVPVGTRLLIAPGERADLLMDFRAAPAGTKWVWTNNAQAPFPNGSNNLKKIMQFTVGSATGFTGAVPSVLRSGDRAIVPLTATAPARTVFLNEVIDPATGTPTEVLLNNLDFLGPDGQPRTEGIAEPRLNTVEVWTIVNTTADAHPIHLHLTQFQVLNRQNIKAAAYLAAVNPALPDPSVGATGVQGVATNLPPDPTPYLTGGVIAPDPTETGWTDTVKVYPGQVTRIVVPFGGTAAGVAAPFTGDPADGVQRFTGLYVWHCHILEHEENEMMQPYRVVG